MHTRFLDLLTPQPHSTPAEDQRRASRELPDAVRASRLLRWWQDRVGEPERSVLIAVAPYSRYDLALLDLIDERLEESADIRVYVATVFDYDLVERFEADFPGRARSPDAGRLLA